ncbi:MAG: hypothetical protein KDK70_32330 [Myxococcales bacterium]|nr:hypothetical protein [Myxococcales bacterium]
MASRSIVGLVGVLLALACGDDGAPGTNFTSGTTDGSSSGTTDGPGTSTGSAESSTGPQVTTGVADSTGGSSSTGPAAESSSGPGDTSTSTGDPPPANGCADGEREALTDESIYPDIAACSGAWSLPGVRLNTPFCNRQGGDDGPLPTGRGCSIEDLCSEGWHVCDGLGAVLDHGIADCEAVFWGGAFFATRQSGMGGNSCNATGLNDVFGCGDVGYTNISGCAPLNRGTGNLCVELVDPWSCDGSNTQEAEQLVKDGPEFGGALCCRD